MSDKPTSDRQREEWLTYVRKAKAEGMCPFGGGQVRHRRDSKGFGPGLACIVCDCFAQPYSDLAEVDG